jgi:mRNA-degrading endonuclease toxin of MazEF toxin-antitoxin module
MPEQENEINKLDFLDAALANLKKQILGIDLKKQKILAAWINVWASYIRTEETFNPTALRKYKRGEIIHLNLGYNIGSELGGTRYAVVVEANNSQNNKTVVVVPISALKNGKTKDDLHFTEVYLGAVIPNSRKESYARTSHIRGVSKMRIIKPKKYSDGIYRLNDDLLNEIDEKVKLLLTFH